jgi:hypothetical protein
MYLAKWCANFFRRFLSMLPYLKTAFLGGAVLIVQVQPCLPMLLEDGWKDTDLY